LNFSTFPSGPADFDRIGMIGLAQPEIQARILRREIPARRNHILDHSQAIRLDDDAGSIGIPDASRELQSRRYRDPVVYGARLVP
jgi:hypothetical protein